ncbi:hypothetical protein BT67DRAFT_449946 [Trichocladium antarcticum]|uniref:Protein kinase domain-containing protein n=1 Tax=Trichocladium antarcticum TaxID=1450529 RepID=A0AAN6UJF0_9PEZI|nr:hypothetical protein BT67DRAFT_449946 [Trichocladium antarcticum]
MRNFQRTKPDRAVAYRIVGPGPIRTSLLVAQSARLLRSRPSLLRCFPRTPRQRRVLFTSISSTVAPPSIATSQQPLAKGTQVTSPSGRSYIINKIIYQRSRGSLLYCLYRASYILKDILPGDFQYIQELQKLIDSSAYVQTLVNSIPNRHMFIYPFLDTNLQLVETIAIPPFIKIKIIKDALTGLANLHDKGVYHTDIKPANIIINSFRQSDKDAIRSPEAWARAAQYTPANIFSFGIIAIYIWLDRIVFFSDKVNEAKDLSDIILRLYVSYFVNDLDDFGSFIEYYRGDTFNSKDKKRAPFRSKITYLNPLGRITAREVL